MVSNSVNNNFNNVQVQNLNNPRTGQTFNGFTPSDAQGAVNIQSTVDGTTAGLYAIGQGNNIFGTTDNGDYIFNTTTNFSSSINAITGGPIPNFNVAQGGIYPWVVPDFANDTTARAIDVFAGVNFFTKTYLDGRTAIGGSDANGNLLEGGPLAAPGFPIYTQNQFGGASAVNTMGNTFAAIGALLPQGGHPTLNQNGITFYGQDGRYAYYPPQPVQAAVAGAQTPTPYSTFQPVGGVSYPYQIGGVVNTFPPSSSSGFPSNSVINGTTAGSGIIYGSPFGNSSQQQSFPNLNSYQGIATFVNLIRNNPFRLPDVIPFYGANSAHIEGFLNHFNFKGEAVRTALRKDYSNPTTVDRTLLNQSGIIKSTPGKYGQGVVVSPFDDPDFLKDTNPGKRIGSGVVYTGLDGDGKFKGTSYADIAIASQKGPNIFDGQGGMDTLWGSNNADLINVYAGDRVFSNADNDIMMFDVPSFVGNSRATRVEGGADFDILVLRINSDPTKGDGVPSFRQLPDGTISVEIMGVEVLTRDVERFIVTDMDGNIGGTYDTQSFTLNDPQFDV
ncbi:MAG: hypothetical protein KC475_01490 [Cyanobacteria bacterium HKST-UBA03]|nr:hypothetical protein [Cyanobacteria bacterium HKST-UBA03]